MDADKFLTEQFEANRSHLRAVAYRMLGSTAEADDAVQETWLRLNRSDTSAVNNLGGWLTTVVARVCLDMLRSRTAKREDFADAAESARIPDRGAADPEHEAVVADSVGLAMLVVLETLTPSERVSFVLHDMFGVPFEDIAAIVGRTPTATRQLASRARNRVQGKDVTPGPDVNRQRQVVEAFLAASRSGDFAALLALLDPDVVLRSDAAAVLSGADAEAFGAQAVAATFAGRARGAQLALIDGFVGLVWSQGGVPRVVFDMTVVDDRIVAIHLLADQDHLARLELAKLGD